MKLTAAAVRNRLTVYAIVAFVLLVGVQAYRSLPLEAAPDIQIPVVLVTTAYPGVGPADVENLVTDVLERELEDLDGVKRMRSTSADSLSHITIEFEPDVDMDEAYQRVRDEVDQAVPDLPPEAEAPTLAELNFSEFPILLVNVFGPQPLHVLKDTAEDVADRIEGIAGVLEAEVVGGEEREVQVLLDPHRMAYYALGVGAVVGRVAGEHRDTPGGSVELGGTKRQVRVPGEYDEVRRMEEIVLAAPQGRPVTVADVGRVVDGFAERESISRVNGVEGVTLRVKKRAGENIVRIADDVRDLLAGLETSLPAGTGVLVRQDQSEQVREMVADLENSIITGLVLVLGVIVFVMGFRGAFFVAFAIPLSMLLTFLVLQAMGLTLNMVVLFALILALGMLVDNSIVVMENIYRYASAGTPPKEAAVKATREVAWPIIASTATTIVAFAPLLFWPDIMGEWMGFLPRTIITALLASLFVALVVNPVAAAGFLRVKKGATLFGGDTTEGGDPAGGGGRVVRGYRRLLSWTLDHPKTVLAGAVLVLVGIGGAFARYGAGVELFPQTTPDRARISIEAPQGTALARTDAFVRAAERHAATLPNVADVVANVGVSGGGPESGGGQTGAAFSHTAVIEIEFRDRAERTGSTWDDIDALRDALADMAGARFVVDVEKMGPPTGAPIAVELSGPDFGELERLAREVSTLLATVPGVVDIQDDHESGRPEVRIVVDREQAFRRKVSTALVAEAIRTAVNGTPATVLREGDDEIDIVVRYDEPFRDTVEDILAITVTGKDDVQIPLRDVARVETVAGVGSIRHKDRARTLQVSADVDGRSSAEALVDVRRVLDERLALPEGYAIAYAGENEEQEKAVAFLQRAFGIGVLLIFIILITQFNSLFRPLIILASVLMSMGGVLLGLTVTGNRFGIIMTGMGVISLAGVVVNNAIVLIDYIERLRAEPGRTRKDAILTAGLIRFRPVLLTAVTTILGLLPMALGVSFDFGSFAVVTGGTTTEWWAPMAQAVAFGLAFATILTLVLVPAMVEVQLDLTERAAALWRRLTRSSGAPAPESA